MSWFRRRSSEAGAPVRDEPPDAEDEPATADELAAAAFDDSPADDEPASPFEAAVARLAREKFAPDPERDAKDRACLDEIAARGPGINAACKSLLVRHNAVFKRRLDQLHLSDDDQALLINGLFIDLCTTLTRDKQPIRCPADRVPLAWLRVALMNRTRNWFKEQKRAGVRVELSRGQLSPHLYEDRLVGELVAEQLALDDESDARDPYSLERRHDDPTFDVTDARMTLLQVRDELDKRRCSDPQRIKCIELLEAVWSGQLNGKEVAQFRWQDCLKACELRCVQADCKEGSEAAGRKALSRARDWLQPLIRHLHHRF
jgi:hypothetical protein